MRLRDPRDRVNRKSERYFASTRRISSPDAIDSARVLFARVCVRVYA